MRRILLAHRDDAETLAAIPALAERYAASVITLTLDVGQDGSTVAFRDRALAAGAIRAHIIDVREEFVRAYLLPLLHAGAARDDAAGQGAALWRSLLADKLLEVCRMEGATFVAHPFDPDGVEAAYLERTIRSRAPEVSVVAAAALQEAGSPRGSVNRPATAADRQRMLALETNLWWRRLVLQAADPAMASRTLPTVRAGLFTVVPPDRCPSSPATIAITFHHGIPTAINGVEMPLIELVEAVDTIAGDHGVGRAATTVAIDGGWRTEIVEFPAAVVLSAAHEALARAVASPALWQIRRMLGRRYADLLAAGEWHSDAREALDVFGAATGARVSGTVQLKLRRGRCRVVARDVSGPRAAVPALAGKAAHHRTPAPAAQHALATAADTSLPH
jgi:argininosuccinate synthase